MLRRYHWPLRPPTEHPHKLPNLIVKEPPNFYAGLRRSILSARPLAVNTKGPRLQPARAAPKPPAAQASRVFYPPTPPRQAFFKPTPPPSPIPAQTAAYLPGISPSCPLGIACPETDRPQFCVDIGMIATNNWLPLETFSPIHAILQIAQPEWQDDGCDNLHQNP